MKNFSKVILLFCVAVIIKLISAQTVFVRRQEVHSDTTLTCMGPTGTIRWGFKKTADSPLLPITAANGSHYRIEGIIIGLEIFDCREEDDGLYIVQGDGGVECHFDLNIFGIFSFSSGTKNPSNYEESIKAVNGYGITVSCSYNITEVSDAQDTFVNVEGIINQVSLADCTTDEYPFCDGCEACYPKLNNSFRQNIVYPTIGPGSTSLTCRVNLGNYYNGKTVEKIVTINRKAVSKETYVVPYKSTYDLCSNTPDIKSEVLVSTQITGDIPINQARYSVQSLPMMEVMSELSVSCQNLDWRGFPLAGQSYQFSIQLSAIPVLSTTQQEEQHFNISYCGSDPIEIVKQSFNCSYRIEGASEGQSHNKSEVTWTLDAAACTATVCEELGVYKEENLVDIRELGNDRDTEHTLRCSVTVNGVSIDKEWEITLSFKVCATTPDITTPTTTTMPTPTPTMTESTETPVSTATAKEETPSTTIRTDTTSPTEETMEIVSTPSTGILIAIIIPSLIFVFVVISLTTMTVIIAVIYFWTKEKTVPNYSQVKTSKQNGEQEDPGNSVITV